MSAVSAEARYLLEYLLESETKLLLRNGLVPKLPLRSHRSVKYEEVRLGITFCEVQAAAMTSNYGDSFSCDL